MFVLQNESDRDHFESMAGGLESLEQLSSWGASMQNIAELNEEAKTGVYDKYSFQMKEDTNNLAINEYKRQVSLFFKQMDFIIPEDLGWVVVLYTNISVSQY